MPAGALETTELPEGITRTLRASPDAAGRIGFELPETLCVHRRADAERLVQAIESAGSFLVLDDFAFDTNAIEFLRSKALRQLHVDAGLIGAALRDKLAQARIVAILQAARVLGLHCVAKQVQAETTRRWLTAAGFDLACGPLFEGARPLASLKTSATTDSG
jgi:EAL domain-containing protein (putative c-di-GMP-specific phosphodiesterase class I)